MARAGGSWQAAWSDGRKIVNGRTSKKTSRLEGEPHMGRVASRQAAQNVRGREACRWHTWSHGHGHMMHARHMWPGGKRAKKMGGQETAYLKTADSARKRGNVVGRQCCRKRETEAAVSVSKAVSMRKRDGRFHVEMGRRFPRRQGRQAGTDS
eukprot:27827-Chlamydomonas_euryale.AAC.1